ncbi:general stress protein [Jeotgalibacillus soli]|uniref:General stress protein 17M-like domain-containing protein n=1 Tax=Jeotgalibacillus soli TaxID=889306 RepID=A0A0C2W062_9BACL|nr:general stress protein [Jeotgalibacillus soli]KIL49563.1 hypothetical protein KP78_10310 [Jeotgalibacillus soli]
MTTKHVETFQSEEQVLQKIEELKLNGYDENDIYVMARHKDELSMVSARTDVETESAEGNWMDKFKAFVTGDTPVREAFDRMGLDKEDTARYYDEVQNGAILLYADSEYSDSAIDREREVNGTMDSYSTRQGVAVADQDEALISKHEPLETDKERFGSDHYNDNDPQPNGLFNKDDYDTAYGNGSAEQVDRHDHLLKDSDSKKTASDSIGRNDTSEMNNEERVIKQSGDAVDAGTPRNSIRPDQEGEAPHHSDRHSVTAQSGGQEQEEVHHSEHEDNPNSHNHDLHPHPKGDDSQQVRTSRALDPDHGNDVDEDRRLIEEERVFRNKDRL